MLLLLEKDFAVLPQSITQHYRCSITIDYFMIAYNLHCMYTRFQLFCHAVILTTSQYDYVACRNCESRTFSV